MELGKGKLSVVDRGGSKVNESNEFGVFKLTRKIKTVVIISHKMWV